MKPRVPIYRRFGKTICALFYVEFDRDAAVARAKELRESKYGTRKHFKVVRMVKTVRTIKDLRTKKRKVISAWWIYAG